MPQKKLELIESSNQTTDANAGKPIATINGAATAAGVPKPEAPSIKQPITMQLNYLNASIGTYIIEPFSNINYCPRIF